MANTNAPFGLRFVRRLDGATPNLNLLVRRIAYNEADAIGKGSLITQLTDGYIERYDASDATAEGVFWGCEYADPTVVGGYRWSNSWTAPSLASGTIVRAYIISDPMAVFEVQTGTAAAVTFANIGENADVVVGTPNTITGWSQSYLNQGSLNTTPTLPLRIVDVRSIADGRGLGDGYDDTSAYNRVEVVFNTLSIYNRTGLA